MISCYINNNSLFLPPKYNLTFVVMIKMFYVLYISFNCNYISVFLHDSLEYPLHFILSRSESIFIFKSHLLLFSEQTIPRNVYFIILYIYTIIYGSMYGMFIVHILWPAPLFLESIFFTAGHRCSCAFEKQ